MSIGRTPRLFKIFAVTFVAVIFLLMITRQQISQTSSLDDFESQKAFLNEVKARLAEKNKIIDKNNDAEEIEKNGPQQVENQIQEQNAEEADGDAEIPFDDSMPGGYLKFLAPAATNKSFCKYNYELPYDLVYTSSDYLFPPQLGKESPHRIIYNVTEAYNTQNVPQITYATHMTANFAYFLPELLKQWDGLVTVAAFVPDLDSALFLEQIVQFCYCEPEMHRVSIHIVTHKLLPFSKKDIYFEKPETCIPQDSSKISILKDYDETVLYPVNVVRNVARTSALTKYVFLSDIELMPSKGLANGFLQMIKKFNKTNPKEVFVVPIFEVEEGEFIPENKEGLVNLINSQKAVYFHGMVCKHCQKFPGIDNWMTSGYSEYIKPLVTVKRHDPYHRWEPIFIGTNEEPLYSEKLSWEGLQDKMTQSLEMCLLDYNYTILDNAFLCHWPGIKKTKVADEEWRADFVDQNRLAYSEIIKNLQEYYEDIPGCRVNFTGAKLPEKKTTESIKLKYS